jgi:DNA-binding beta-propeller fold protein YncE
MLGGPSIPLLGVGNTLMRNWSIPSQLSTSACLLVVTLIAGCSHGQQSTAGQRLYAAIPETGSIAVYPVTGSGAARPLAMIRETPPDKPIDVSVDLIGEVFVANENGNMRAYGARNFHYELIHTLEGQHTRIEHPTAIVANFDGTFYIADAGSSADRARVEWFAAGQNGNIFPNRVIAGPHCGVTSPRGLALDGSGRLFVADQATNNVLVFASDAEGDAAPIVSLNGLHSPAHLYVDQLLNIYVSNQGDNSIKVFISTGPQSWSPAATITSAGMIQPLGVAADQTGRIAVASSKGILFFAPESDGRVEPASVLDGPTLMNPAGIFIH